jgi:hypothetical protein
MYEKFLGLLTLFFLLKIEGIAGIAKLAWATGWTAGLNSQQGQAIFSLLHSVQTSHGGHPPSYPMGAGVSFPLE